MYAALSGIKVLDLSRMLPGPFCSMILGDLGAEVIKVESVRLGDPARLSPPYIGGESAYFLSINRNKKSIALNLKNKEGREVFYKLAQGADVLLEGFKPGRAEQLGIGYNDIRKLNPRLIYCSLSGYGQEGPWKDRAGHDINYLALSGMFDLLWPAGQPGQIPSIQLGDICGGALFASIAILAALVARSQTESGTHIDASIFHGLISLAAFSAAINISPQVHSGREHLYLAGLLPCYNVYQTKDGRYMALGAIEPVFWADFCKAIGREDLIAKQFPSEAEREMVVAELAGIFAERTREEWIAFFADQDVCCEPVNTLEEALAHPQLKQRGMIFTIEHPTAGPIRQVGLPFSSTAYDPRRDSPPPLLGQHTVEILKCLGYDEETITGLRAKRVVATPQDLPPRREMPI